MANVQNNQNSGNVPTKKTKRNFMYYKKTTNNKSGSNTSNSGSAGNTKSPLQKEYKFYLHDSAAKKAFESFDKIKKHIILKIQQNFTDSLGIVDSLETRKKKVFKKPKVEKSELDDDAERLVEQQQFQEE